MWYHIKPVPKPRQTRSDKWKKRPCVMRYRAFADECRAKNVQVESCGSMIVFGMPMPKSWSKKKKAEMKGMPHQQKPDIDNLLKALLDAVHKDDAHIYSISVRKVWSSDDGYISIV